MSDVTSEQEKKRTRETSAYPKRSLIDALQIATAIKEHNAGNPYDILDLAKAVNRSPGSSEFRMLITASGQFGLTEGSYAAKNIALAPLGRSIVYPADPKEKAESLKVALFKIPFYRKFFEDFDKNKLPSVDYLEGTLNRTYGIPVQDCKNCYSLIVKNAEELGILDEISGSKWINLSKLSPSTSKEEDRPPKPIPGSVAIAPSSVSTPVVRLPVAAEEGIIVKVNINFELPITKDAEVYDKIFRSLKQNLLTSDSKAD